MKQASLDSLPIELIWHIIGYSGEFGKFKLLNHFYNKRILLEDVYKHKHVEFDGWAEIIIDEMEAHMDLIKMLRDIPEPMSTFSLFSSYSYGLSEMNPIGKYLLIKSLKSKIKPGIFPGKRIQLVKKRYEPSQYDVDITNIDLEKDYKHINFKKLNIIFICY